MFEGLRTNLPADLMAFRDVPFPEGTPLFPERSEVLAYLEAFAETYRLLPYIRFETPVVQVSRTEHSWRITSDHHGVRHVDEYDAVAVAQGRCNTPYVPLVPGRDRFEGEQIHSAWYRTPAAFRNKRVLVVGSMASASDVTRELAGGSIRSFPGDATWQPDSVQVWQSHHYREAVPFFARDRDDPSSPAWARRIHHVGPISHIDAPRRVVFEDGLALDIDVIVWATGFLYSLPFGLDGDALDTRPMLPKPSKDIRCAPEAHAASVLLHLDDWLLFYKHAPNLCFLGIPSRIVPFPLAQLQSRVAAHRFLDKIGDLPRIRQDLPPSDPARWVVQPPSTGPGPERWGHFAFSGASELAYHDALLALLPDPRGAIRAPAESAHADGRHPKEGWYQLAQWRRDRRMDALVLRMAALGY